MTLDHQINQTARMQSNQTACMLSPICCSHVPAPHAGAVDCETNYFPADITQAKYGCAPNQYESWPTVFDLNAQAGDGRDATLVLEFAEEAIKV